MQEHSKKIQELSNFLLDYATTLMAVGSHTSRIVKNVTRIAESFGFGVDMTIFQRNITMTVKHSEDYSIRRTYVRRIPAMALNFRTISDLSARAGKLMTTIRDFTSCSSGSIPLSTPHVCHAGWSCCWLPVPMLHFAVCSEEIRSPWDWYGLPPWPAFLSVRNSPNFS